MSMLPSLDESRFSQGMSTERYSPWYGQHLEASPVSGVEGLVGIVSVVTLLSPDGGCSYEQTEHVNGRHHRHLASGPVPNVVRPA